MGSEMCIRDRFHRNADPAQWLLYSQESPSAQGGRGLGIGRVYTRDGQLTTTIAQEGMVRVKDDCSALFLLIRAVDPYRPPRCARAHGA